MLPYGLNQTNTHSTSYDSFEHALAHLAEALKLTTAVKQKAAIELSILTY